MAKYVCQLIMLLGCDLISVTVGKSNNSELPELSHKLSV